MTAVAPTDPARAAGAALARTLLREEPYDAAGLLETAEPAEAAALLGEVDPELATSVIRCLTPGRAARVLAALPEAQRGRVLRTLPPGVAAALLARFDDDERRATLAALEGRAAAELEALASYGPDTAGGLMDPRVMSFRPDASVEDVIQRLRGTPERRVQECYLVDAEGRLTGALSLQDVVLAEDDARLSGLARPDPVRVPATSSRQEAVDLFESHRIASLPVVDFEGRLLGVLRQRELIEAAQAEATASAVTMVGASEQEKALSSPWFAIRKRLPWLQINLLTAFLAAAVVGVFEDTIARVTALAVLLPVVAGQSGNTGAQALAVTMRGLALREVQTRHWLRVTAKELTAGAGNGIAVAVTTSLAVFVWSGSAGLATVIAVSMVISMALAGLSGAAIPMVLTALRQDPAQSSSIILTTVTDVVGFFSFLGIASLLLASGAIDA